jgi:hypothetical protein
MGEPGEDTTGSRGVSFRISVPDAEELTAELRDHVERGEWHARYAVPGVPVSFLNGWTRVGMGIRVEPQAGVAPIVGIREWAGVWENHAGDYLEYHLMALRFEARPLTEVRATARYLPATLARQLPGATRRR